MMGQETLRQHLHTLVTQEAQKIAAAIVDMAAFIGAQMAADECEARQRPSTTPKAVDPQAGAPPGAVPHHWIEYVRQETPGPVNRLPTHQQPGADKPCMPTTTADATFSAPQAAADVPQVVPQVWEARLPTTAEQEAAPLAARHTMAPPHWLQRIDSQPPAPWLERVRQSAPALLPSLVVARRSEIPQAHTAAAAPVAPDHEAVEATAADNAPVLLLTGESSLSPAPDATPTPWPELFPEAPGHVPEDQDAILRAWERYQRLKQEQQGQLWNA